MKAHSACFLFAVLLTLSIAAGESETPPMPDGVGTVITIRSAGELAAGAAAYADGAELDGQGLADTPLLPGLPAMAALAEASGDMTGEWHLFAPPGASPFREHALSVPVTNFAAFREKLVERGASFRSLADGATTLFTLAGIGEYYCGALDDDRVVMAMTPGLLDAVRRLARDGELPAHEAEGVLGVRVARSSPAEPEPQWRPPAPSLLNAIINVYVGALTDIILKTDGLEADISVGGEQILVRARIRSRPDSLLHRMTGAPGVSAAPPFLAAVDLRPMAVAITAPPAQLFPGLADFDAGEIAAALRTEHGEPGRDIARHAGAALAALSGESVVARYAGEQGGYYAAWIASDAPDAATAAARDLFAAIGRIPSPAGKSGTGEFPDIDMIAVEEARTPGGVSYLLARASDALRDRILGQAPFLLSLGGGALSAAGALHRASLFIAAVDGGVLIMAGLAGESEFADLVDAAGPERPLARSAAYAGAVRGMPAARSVTALLDINGMYLEHIESWFAGLKAIETIGGRELPPEARAFVDAYAALRPSLLSERTFAGVGISADGDVLALDISLPAAVVGHLERNRRRIASILEPDAVAEVNRVPAPSPARNKNKDRP